MTLTRPPVSSYRLATLVCAHTFTSRALWLARRQNTLGWGHITSALTPRRTWTPGWGLWTRQHWCRIMGRQSSGEHTHRASHSSHWPNRTHLTSISLQKKRRHSVYEERKEVGQTRSDRLLITFMDPLTRMKSISFVWCLSSFIKEELYTLFCCLLTFLRAMFLTKLAKKAIHGPLDSII